MISKNKGGLFGCLNLKMFEKSIKVVFFVEIHRASTQIQIYWSFTVKSMDYAWYLQEMMKLINGNNRTN